MPINAETKIPSLLLDYVDSRRTELSIPDSDALPFYEGIRDGVMQSPCVVFYCDAFDMAHPERMNLTVVVALLNDRSAEEASEEIDIAAQIRSALADHVSFFTWLAALTSNERTGWRITKHRVTGGGIEIDPELNQRRRFTRCDIHAITSETTFPA